MIPSNSGGSSSAGCNPISSNCVIWQGPDIPCINLCAGDSVSQVLAQMAHLLCDLQPSGDAACCDVSLLDPQCLTDFYKRQYGGDIPDDWVLQNYINLLIEYVCQLSFEGGGATLPMMPVPNCVPRVFLNGDIIDNDDGMDLVLPDGSIYMIDTEGLAGQFFNGNYTGWADMVVSVMCNLLACCSQMSAGGLISGTGPSTDAERPMTKDWINKLIDQKFTKLSTNLRYVPKKVVPKFVTNKVGRPVAMEVMLTALEKEFGALRSITGTPLQLRDAIKKQCMNLNTEDRLAGKGTFGTMQGWNLTPSTLAESHANQWSVLCDVHDAVKDIQQNHLDITQSCKDITYDCKLSLIDTIGEVTGLSLDFTGTSVKTPFKDSDPRGAKITVVDSSLTTIIKYVPLAQLQGTTRPVIIEFSKTKIDRTSNYQITIDYSFSNGDSVCAKTITYTLENETVCPKIVANHITGNSFNYNVLFDSSFPTDATMAVICETTTGTEIGRNIYTKGKINTGQFGGLNGGQTFHVYCEITSKAGNLSSCDKIAVTTTMPACATASVALSEYGDKLSDLQGARLELGVYNDGANTWTTVLGFDANQNVKVVRVNDFPNASATAGVSIATYGTFTSNDPSMSIVCNGQNYVSGFPQSSIGSGWQYVNVLNNPNGNPYYVYALVNKVNNTIDKVVACCDCKAVYIKTHNTMNYCVTGKTTDIKIDVAGFVSGVEKPKWTLVSGPTHGNAYLNNIKSTTNEICYTYQSIRSTSDWISDSFVIETKNDCGSSNQLIIPVAKAEEISRTDGDITVFVDTCTMTYTDAILLKESFEAVKTAAKDVCSNWTGTINYVPVDTRGDSGDYINHAKAMIDMKSGASGSITVAGGSWTNWKSLPSYWDASYKGSVPTSAYVFSFVSNTSTSCGTYGESTLTAGFGAQPSVSYQNNYDELLDFVNGTTTTAWGGLMNSTQAGWGFPIFGTATNKTKYFTQVLMPIISDIGNATAATALQMSGALLGGLINKAESRGLKVGDVRYPVNLAPLMENGIASLPVPYNVSTPVGNPMKGLKEYGYVSSFWLENGVNLGVLNLDLKAVLLSILGLNADYSGFNCTTSTPIAKRMTDTVNTKDTFSTGASCAAASDNASKSVNPMAIYNKTGVLFDTTAGNKLAFKTAQGCAEGHDSTTSINDEIANGWYGVVAGLNNYKIAQYTQGSGWSHEQCMDGSGGCKAC